MNKKPLYRVIALAICVIMMLGILPVSAADTWNEYKVVTNVANSTVDTENFTWSSDWRIYEPVGIMDCNEAFINGQNVEFDFNGTGLAVTIFKNVAAGGANRLADDVSIFIDGTEYALECGSATEFVGNAQAFSLTGLENKDHTAKIVNNSPTGMSFYLHSVSVLNGTIGKSVTTQWGEMVYADVNSAANTDYFSFKSTAGWRNTNAAVGYQEAYTPGDSVSFGFNGRGVQIYAQVNVQDLFDAQGNYIASGDGTVDILTNNNVYISIDGAPKQQLSLNNSSVTPGTDTVVYEVTGLADSYHDAVITVEQYTSPSVTNSFYFKGIKVANGEAVKQPQWSELYSADLTETDANGYSLPNTEYFKYSANWRDINTVDDTYETWLPGETASFDFDGTGLAVYAYVNTQDRTNDGYGVGVDTYVNNNVTISIDGGAAKALNMVADSYCVGNMEVFRIAGLEDTSHTAVITNGQSASNDTGFYFQGVKVADGELKKQSQLTWGEEIVAVDRNDVASTGFAYSGASWSQFSDAVGEKYMRSGTGGESLDFGFYGTGVRIYASVNVQNGQSLNNDEIYVSIDGKDFVKANMWVNATPGSSAVIYEVSGLEEGTHTVTVENRARVSNYGSQFFFHGVSLANGGYLVDAPEWSGIIRAVSDTHVINPDYTFTGQWSDQTPYMRAVALNDKVEFTVDGTGFKVYAMVNVQSDGKGGWICYNNDVVYISIDGGEKIAMDMYAEGVVANTAIYAVQGLSEGEHTVTITNGANVKGNNKEFYFSGVSVLNGELVDSRGKIDSLTVEQMPEKLYYGEDTKIDLTGLKLKANNDPDYIIQPNLRSVGIKSVTPNASGEYHLDKEKVDEVQEIICTYKDIEFTIPLTYYSVNDIEVTTLPKVEYYTDDDHFVTSGGEISVVLGGESIAQKPVAKELLKVSMITTDFPESPAIGQEVEVECEYLNTKFSYNIIFVNAIGDIDGDGDMDADDLTLLVKHIVGDKSVSLASYAVAAGDIDGFAGVTMDDATELAKAIEAGKAPGKPQAMVTPAAAPTAAELTPDNSGAIIITGNNVRHIGRTYYNNTLNGYNFNWSCTGFEFNFSGTKAQIQLVGDTIFDSKDTYPLVQVFVDGADEPSKVLTLTGSKAWYTLAEGLSDGEHTIKILKQNQTAYSSALATAIKVDGVLLAPNTYKDFGVQIIGDSISAGMFNETVGEYEGSYVLAEENSYNTAYAMVARKLGADFTIFANSGAACNESAGPVRRDVQVGRNVTAQYKYTDLFWGYEGLHEKDNIRTDLIIINLGTNDNDYIGSNPERKQAFIDAYVELLRHLRALYPEAPIVCTYGVIITSPSTLIETAVNTVRTEDGDTNVYFHMEDILPTTRHPRTSENEVYAEKFISYLKSEGIID